MNFPNTTLEIILLLTILLPILAIGIVAIFKEFKFSTTLDSLELPNSEAESIKDEKESDTIIHSLSKEVEDYKAKTIIEKQAFLLKEKDIILTKPKSMSGVVLKIASELNGVVDPAKYVMYNPADEIYRLTQVPIAKKGKRRRWKKAVKINKNS